MAGLSSQFAIINKIKSLVAKTGKSILWRAKPKDNDISEKIAQKIQKNSYDLSLLHTKDTLTPPYLSLAEQLQVEDEQIFRAAVYNLANIAKERAKYTDDIVRLLEDFCKDESKGQELRDYVGRKMGEIKATTSKAKKSAPAA